jgi:hypothetical protein
MSESVQTNPVVDAPESEPSTTLGLGGPVPLPGPTGPAPVVIPDDGEPADIALKLLDQIVPDSRATLAARIAGLDGQVADLIERFRLNTREGFGSFVEHVGRIAKARRALLVRAGETPEPAAVTALAAIKAVRRWRDGAPLKVERSRIVQRLRGELAQVEGRIRHWCDALAGGANLEPAPGEPHKIGLAHSHDGFLSRCQQMLEERQSLKARLGRLDPETDAGRSRAVQAAVAAVGGADVVVAKLAPTQTAEASAELDKVRRDMEGLSDRLETIDPETNLATALVAELASLDGRVAGLQATIKAQKSSLAAGQVGAATSGVLSAIAALESACAGALPELAGALGSLRGDDATLTATIAELIGA